jgi:pyridoxal phosphate enzyme (YggS family)
MINSESYSKIFKDLLKQSVTLVAVSKTKPADVLLELYNSGQRIFGENKVQEMADKYETLPKDISWHLIGHLQSNKVKYIAGFVSLIHSVDSLKLLKEIDRQAQKNNRVINCLLQFHIAKEESKFGLDYQEATEMLISEDYNKLKNINIIGVMGMASFTEDKAAVRAEFKLLKTIFDSLKKDFFRNKNDFVEISMGMSGDFEIAIEEGATIVRIGSLLFGPK